MQTDGTGHKHQCSYWCFFQYFLASAKNRINASNEIKQYSAKKNTQKTKKQKKHQKQQTRDRESRNANFNGQLAVERKMFTLMHFFYSVECFPSNWFYFIAIFFGWSVFFSLVFIRLLCVLYAYNEKKTNHNNDIVCVRIFYSYDKKKSQICQ